MIGCFLATCWQAFQDVRGKDFGDGGLCIPGKIVVLLREVLLVVFCELEFKCRFVNGVVGWIHKLYVDDNQTCWSFLELAILDLMKFAINGGSTDMMARGDRFALTSFDLVGRLFRISFTAVRW